MCAIPLIVSTSTAAIIFVGGVIDFSGDLRIWLDTGATV